MVDRHVRVLLGLIAASLWGLLLCLAPGPLAQLQGRRHPAFLGTWVGHHSVMAFNSDGSYIEGYTPSIAAAPPDYGVPGRWAALPGGVLELDANTDRERRVTWLVSEDRKTLLLSQVSPQADEGTVFTHK